jgi:hypothetical protein
VLPGSEPIKIKPGEVQASCIAALGRPSSAKTFLFHSPPPHPPSLPIRKTHMKLRVDHTKRLLRGLEASQSGSASAMHQAKIGSVGCALS